MTHQISAGGVIIAIRKSVPYILLLQDKSKNWTFPKGLLEKGEDIAATALREIKEEVGLTKLKLIKELSPIIYFYRWEGKLIHKTVHYYLCQGDSSEKPKPQRAEGIMDVQWFHFDQAQKIIGYKKTNAKVLTETRTYLTTSGQKFVV